MFTASGREETEKSAAIPEILDAKSEVNDRLGKPSNFEFKESHRLRGLEVANVLGLRQRSVAVGTLPI